MRRQAREKVLFTVLGIPMVICLLAFLWIAYILSTGIETLSWRFLTARVFEGGIFDMIVGTSYLLLGSAVTATPIGVLAAIYMVEYAPSGKVTRIIDQAINNLAGVPSIVIGLFGYTFFCRQLSLGISLAAGWLTLALMMLPIIIRGTEEAIRMVPTSFKDAALALGTTKWKAISSTTLSAAAPGVVTSVILGVARVAGETAAILFTACFILVRHLPSSPLDPVMALAYNLYVQIMVLPQTPPQRILGGALVLFILVTFLAIFAIIIRTYYRRKQPWLR
jgi:phosphate transport system permease protein